MVDRNQSQVVFGFKTDMTTATQLDIGVRAFCNGPSLGRMRLFLKNWTTGRFDPIQTFSLGTTAQNFSASNVSFAPYRRSSDQRVEMFVQTFYNGDPPMDPFEVSIDQIKLTPH
jgi:hypothetical protein